MKMDSVERLPPAQLVQMLDMSVAPRWSAEDAAAALRQQLTAPLLPDLAAAPGARLERLEPLTGQGAFLEALLQPGSVEVLHAIKEWSRHIRTDPATPLSPGPATVLYYAAIASALVQFGERITKLSDGQLREGFGWAAGQAGAEALASLFQSAATR